MSSSRRAFEPSGGAIDGHQSWRYWRSHRGGFRPEADASAEASRRSYKRKRPLPPSRRISSQPPPSSAEAARRRSCGSRLRVAGSSTYSCEESLSDEDVRQLYDQVALLTSQLCAQRSENLLLRRDVLVLQKIVKREVGGNALPVSCLLQLSSDRSWKGRQERRLTLRRELRDLKEARLTRSIPTGSRSATPARWTTSRESLEQDLWNLDFERREVLRNAERERNRWVADRDSLKIKVEEMSKKNQDLANELASLKKQVAKNVVQDWDDVKSRQLQDVEAELKIQRRRLWEDRRRLAALEATACQTTKAAIEARANVLREEQAVRDKAAVLEELEKESSSLGQQAQEVARERSDRARQAKSELDRMQQAFDDLANKAACLELAGDHQGSELESNGHSVTPCATDGRGDSGFLDDSPLRKYRSLLESLRRKNREHAARVDALSGKIKHEVTSLLLERHALWKRTCENGVLRRQLEKRRKSSVGPASGRVREANQEALRVGKQCLAILGKENRMVKDLIKRVFESRQADFDLCYRNVLARCKDSALAELNRK